ncbi:LytR/AlgR family response regulator transcription factor [Fusobacterium perfoetens]|uniref:LytR/AlgR family response regulator transcription factor n=1 Tax=Fusobacterium perfoetens TaxID=852 RepID=UPI0004860EFB|nr:LytTR family DNA-binding domain-containing protein [Fusobacterium perfoetens]MCI6151947.1 LytTR family DNA-binding domain-containing protein [Fusobacterium perfoetens]MDY3238287.1 LytTR family DNA-binding domain-containing protein [Fusobacterium perfoetens]
MLSYIIVEDEYPAREELKYFINLYKDFYLENEFDNPIDALKFLENNEVDIAFLDINMPGIDGINLGKIIHKLNPNMKIIFITAYREYGVEAFDIKAFDYILKPYSEERIKKTLEELLKVNQKEENKVLKNELINKLAVSEDGKIIILSLEDIYYIEADEKECLVYTKNKIYTTKQKISKLEEVLSNKKFFKSHRAYLVNVDKIRELEAWFSGSYLIKLENISKKIPLSRNRIKAFKEMFILK